MRITDKLLYLRIYWIGGPGAKRDTYVNSVRNPPCLGWQNAYVLMTEGAKHAHIFCPFSFLSFNVPSDCHEIIKARSYEGFDKDRAVEYLRKQWNSLQARGNQSADYDTAARVFVALGEPIPTQIRKGGIEDTVKKGGKPAASSFLSPVNPKTKKGKILKWFLDQNEHGSIRACMIEFDTTKASVLSSLRTLAVHHGVGYDLAGGDAKIFLPQGVTKESIWIDETPTHKAEDDDWLNEDNDDSWLD